MTWGLLLALEGAAVVLWLPAVLWPFTVSWDENTFLLVGQRMLNGELPYTTTFENKSPLGVLPHAIGLLAVGPNPSMLRLFAALLVGLTAFLIVLIAPGSRLPVPAALTGIAFLLVWVTRTNGLVWMTEVNIALVFVLALFLTVRSERRPAWFLGITGAVIGVIPLVRINWAFVALLLLLAVILANRHLRGMWVAIAGAVLPLFVTVLSYGLSGNLGRLWAGAIELPRQLGNGEGWRLPTLADDQLPLLWLPAILFITALLLMNMQVNRTRGERVSRVDVLLLAIAWALTVGAWIQPYDFPYQTLQILPLVALAVGRVLASVPGYQWAAVIPLAAFCLAMLYVFQTQVVTAFDWRNQAEEESAITSAVEKIPEIDAKSLWIPDDTTYLYWRLGKIPVSPLASMPYLVWEPGGQVAFRGSAVSEGRASQLVFDEHPDLVIADSSYRGSYNGSDDARAVWQENLERDYAPLLEVRGHTVWERLPGR